jgi:hypothetical protein
MMICKMILMTLRASPPRPTSLAVVTTVATLGHNSVAVQMTVGGRRITHAKEIEDVKMIAIVAMITCARMTADMTVGMIEDAKMIAGTADMIVGAKMTADIAVMTVAMTVDAKMTAGIAVIAMMMIVVMEETGVIKAVMISVMVGVAVKGGPLHPLLM